MKHTLCALFIFLNSIPIGLEAGFNFVVWNVGQGSWSTWIFNGQCVHFDMGGETFPWPDILKHCQHKQNQVYITHDDWDHVNGLFHFQKHASDVCVFYPKLSHRKIFKKVPRCLRLHPDIQIISHGSDGKGRNASSLIYLFRKQVLITGDAPKSEENKWYWKLPVRLRVLLIGHHGSITSTSEKLLHHTRPQLAVVSARKKRYGHPHPKVKTSLKKQRTPMLRTEILGSIYFNLK